MKDFKENKCRLCKKIFCCKKCREQHERTKHDIYPDCDICIYGKVFLSSIISADLSEHIQSTHGPLHCLICKRLFESMSDLCQYTKCSISHRNSNDLQKSPYTPIQSYPENAYDSPPQSDNFHGYQSNKKSNISKLATSTPMQREDANLLEKIQEVIITPEYYSENSKNSILKKTRSESIQQVGSGGTWMKRRVTFGETPLTDSQNTKNMTAGTSSGEYHTAKEEQTPPTVEDPNLGNDIQTVPLIKVTDAIDVDDSTKEKENSKENNIPDPCEEDNTVWISATNISVSNLNDSSSSSSSETPDKFVTPIVPNHKKKQINIVMPTPVVKKEMSIKFHRPVQISSTPNSSIIPVKSAPNHRDIFRCEESLPSCSNWNNEFPRARIDYQNDTENIGTDIKKLSLSGDNRTNSVTEPFIDNADVSIQSRLWTSVSRIVKNVSDAIQGFQSADGFPRNSPKSLKRFSSDYDFIEGPNIKRYKLTEIKCRRTIRDLPPIEIFSRQNTTQESNEIHINLITDSTRSMEMRKTFADKATQTDDYFPEMN